MKMDFRVISSGQQEEYEAAKAKDGSSRSVTDEIAIAFYERMEAERDLGDDAKLRYARSCFPCRSLARFIAWNS